MMRIIGFVSALWLGMMLFAVPSFSAWLPGQQADAAMWLGFMLRAAPESPVPVSPVAGQTASAKPASAVQLASDQAVPASATRGADLQVTDISDADADVAALQQCKAACAPQCQTLDNADRAEHCQQSCEMHCNEPPGK
ncbi:MAG: hypothetical protein WAN51_05285 [Alphaproteobacteria bacterium]